MEQKPKLFDKYFLKTDKLKQVFSHPSFGEPEIYKRCTLDNFQVLGEGQVNMISELKIYGGGLLSLLGKMTGTGKTHLAVATAREYYKCRIYEWIDKNSERDFGYKDYAEKEFFEMLENEKPIFLTEFEAYETRYGNMEFKFYLPNRRLVVIDDIFASKNNEAGRAAIYEIVNTAVNYNLPRIFTSNLLPNDMPDNRISSRLQSGSVYIISTTKDYRKE